MGSNEFVVLAIIIIAVNALLIHTITKSQKFLQKHIDGQTETLLKELRKIKNDIWLIKSDQSAE